MREMIGMARVSEVRKEIAKSGANELTEFKLVDRKAVQGRINQVNLDVKVAAEKAD